MHRKGQKRGDNAWVAPSEIVSPTSDDHSTAVCLKWLWITSKALAAQEWMWHSGTDRTDNFSPFKYSSIMEGAISSSEAVGSYAWIFWMRSLLMYCTTIHPSVNQCTNTHQSTNAPTPISQPMHQHPSVNQCTNTHQSTNSIQPYYFWIWTSAWWDLQRITREQEKRGTQTSLSLKSLTIIMGT